MHESFFDHGESKIRIMSVPTWNVLSKSCNPVWRHKAQGGKISFASYTYSGNSPKELRAPLVPQKVDQ